MESRCPVVLGSAGGDVHAESARLRERGPVAEVELPGGVRAWSVTSYELVRQVLADPNFAKDPHHHWPAFVNGEIGPDWPMITWVVMDNMATHDGADHARLRGLISKAFSPRRVEAARPLVQKITRELLDTLAARPDGEVLDLKARFAYPLPARVICDLFGVPEEARADALRGGEVNISTQLTPEEAEANVEQWHLALQRLVETKRAEPGDDLTSFLVTAQDEGSRLSDEELVGTLHLMFGAGSETVMNALSKAIVALLTHPDQHDLVRSGAASWEDVVEETLRLESPIAQFPFRYTTEEVELGGVSIPKGSPVLLGYAAAGRDPALHGETAERFDVTRADKSHLTFGHGFPDLRLAVRPEELEPQETFVMNGHRTLPVYLGRSAW
jgi:cytochrome P450